MIRKLCMAFEARKPFAAAFETDRNYIQRPVPMSASGLPVNLYSVNFLVVDHSHRFMQAGVIEEYGITYCSKGILNEYG
jgi:hypothetical protein